MRSKNERLNVEQQKAIAFTLKKPLVVENDIQRGLAARQTNLPQLVIVPNQRIMTRNTKLQSLAAD